MNIRNMINEYNVKKGNLDQITNEFEKIERDLEPYIHDILKLCYKKEREITAELGVKIYCIYDSCIKYDKLSNFSIRNEAEDYIEVACSYTDRDDEYFCTEIKVPKDSNKIDFYVNQFGEEIKAKILKTIEEKQLTDKAKRQEMFLKLKDEFE